MSPSKNRRAISTVCCGQLAENSVAFEEKLPLDKKYTPPPPPTIGKLKSMGLTGVCPVCRACQHAGNVRFEALGLPDDTLFPEIARARRFRCSSCGARDFAVTPDWQGYRASGMGGMSYGR